MGYARRDKALAGRERLAADPATTAYRLVFAESDGLPGLIVDRYADYLVLQTLSQGMDRLLPVVAGLLGELLSPAGILARNDPRVRALEGLPQTVSVLHGDVPQAVEVEEHDVRLTVDLWTGQKTGLFLDQRADDPIGDVAAPIPPRRNAGERPHHA